MKINYIKPLWAAMLTLALASCQDEKIADLSNGAPNTLRASMSGWGVESRAQVELGNQDTAQEIFLWNSGDGFSLIDLDSDVKTALRYEIAGYNQDEPSATAEFVGKGELIEGHKLLAVYPGGELKYGKVALSVEQDASFVYHSEEEIISYMSKNMVMVANGLVGDKQTDLNFSQATAMVRVSVTNAKGEAMKVSSVTITSPGAFGLTGEYNTADGNVSLTGTAADVMTQNVQTFNILSGETVDFYFLALPGTGIGDFEIAVNDEKVTVPASEFAEKGIEKLEAGNRYWFQLVEGNNGLMRKASVSEGVITNLQLIKAIEASQGIEFFRNEDGFVDVQANKEKIEGITSIRIDGSETCVTSLEGIGYFFNLESLFIQKSQIQVADVTSNKKLRGLNIYSIDFELRSINIEGLESLTNLGLMTADISEIDLSSCKNLMSLTLRNCKLTSIDLSNLSNLRYLNVGYNYLTSLDVTHNAKLETLICDSGYLEISELDLSKNENLTTLCFGSNYSGYSSPIKTLDLSNNTLLESLEIRGCWELQPIDFSQFVKVKKLGLQKCLQFKEINLESNPELVDLQVYDMPIDSLKLNNNLHIEKLDCRRSPLHYLDISMLNSLKVLMSEYCSLQELNISNNKVLENIRCGNQYDRGTGKYIEMVLYMSPEQKQMWLDQESYNNHVRVEMVEE